MIKVILLVAFILGQTLAAQVFEIDWLQNRRNLGGDNNVYEVPENQTSTPNNNDTNRIFSIEERVLNVENDNTPTSTEETTSATTTTNAATTTSTPENEVEIPQVTQGDVNDFRQKMRMFAAKFYSQVLKDTDANENIIYSPISITHAMGMMNTGARGNSSRQIKESLQFDADTQNSYIDSLFRNITSSKFSDSMELDVIKLMVARSFIQKGFTVQPQFLKAVQTQYHSDIMQANFLFPKEATNQINQWVEEKTNQLIKDLLSPGIITVDTRLVLVNAIYFKAPWSTKFSELSQNAFTTPTGKVTVPFMTETIRCRYHDTSYSEFIAIPYEDGETYFFVIVPKSDDVLKSFEDKRFLGQYFKDLDQKIFNEWKLRRIELHMPKFSVEQKIDVETILKSMGVTDIFDHSSADLSGIAKDLYVSDFVHKAKLSVDEKGTEAAAASAVVVAGRTLVKEVYVDRPFLFGVIESKGDILFMGKVVNPSGK